MGNGKRLRRVSAAKWLLSVFLSIVAVTPVIAQVHIMENVTIAPRQTRTSVVGGANSNVLSFTLYLQYSADTAIVVVNGPNGYYKVFSSLGSVAGEIQSPAAGTYTLTPCIAGYQQDYHLFDMNNCFTVYYDSVDIGGQHCGTFEGGSYGKWDVMKDLVKSFSTPYFSKFKLSMSGMNPGNQPDYLGHGESGGIGVEGYDDSTTTSWSPSSDPIQLSVISGSSYVSFHRPGSDTFSSDVINTVGDSISSDPYGLHAYYITADGAEPDSNASWIVVEAESNGLVSMDSLEMMPPPVVTVTPSEIPPDSTATITVKHRDFDGQLTDYPANQLFEVGISDSEGYGGVFSSDSILSDYLTGVQPPLGFFAYDTDSSSVNVGIRVGTLYSGPVSIESANPAGRMPAGGGSTTEKAMGQTDGKGSSLKSTPLNMSTKTRKENVQEVQFYSSDYGIGYVTIKVKQNGPNLNLPRYSQGDSRWRNITYDHSKHTIQNWGCALYSMAWVLSAYGHVINPEQLNEWMNGEDKEHGGYVGADVNWDAIYYQSGETLTATKFDNEYFGNEAYTNKPGILNDYLNNGDLVIAQVNDGGSQHWVVVKPEVNGEYPIMDPGDGSTSNLNDYAGIFWKYVVVSRLSGN